jgi:ADP-L-glycero-D-manno-heptose 6-epimerase
MKAIVSGGSGFVGSNMIKRLNKQGINDIVIIDNYNEAKFKNLKGLHFSDYVDYSDGIPAIKTYLESSNVPEVFFHIGANADVLEYNPKVMMSQNYEFSKMYCNYCRLNNVTFIYASSSAIYGNGQSCSVNVDNEHPHNMYSWSKWMFDRYVIENLPHFKNKIIGFRFFNVFGIGESHKGKNACIANRFVNFIREKGFIDLFDEKISRDYVWVEDLVEVLFRIWLNTDIKNGIYNLGGANTISHKEIAELVVTAFIDSGQLTGSKEQYIKFISMPKDLKHKFQFYTCAEDLLPCISEITIDNKLKLKHYIDSLIQI